MQTLFKYVLLTLALGFLVSCGGGNILQGNPLAVDPEQVAMIKKDGEIARIMNNAREKYPEWRPLQGIATIAYARNLPAGRGVTCPYGARTNGVGIAQPYVQLGENSGALLQHHAGFTCMEPHEGARPTIVLSTACLGKDWKASIVCQAVFVHEFAGHVLLGAPGCSRTNLRLGKCTKEEIDGEKVGDMLAQAWVPVYRLVSVHASR